MAEKVTESAKPNTMNYAIIAGSVFITFVLWMFFLSATGGIMADFLNIDVSPLIAKVFSMNFTLFALIFPLTYALVISFCTKFSKVEVMSGSVVGALLGAIVSALLFSGSMQYWPVLIFYLASLLLVAETTFARLEELKKWVMLRTLNQGFGQAFSILSIGIIAFGVITLLPMNEQYVKNVEAKLFEGVSKNVAGGDLTERLAENAAKAYLQGQKDTMRMLTGTEVYASSTDEMLKGLISEGETQVNSGEYGEQVTEKYKEAGRAMGAQIQGGNLDMTAMVKQQFPFIAVMEKFMWAFNSLILASAFMFVASVIFRPLGIIYGLVITKVAFGR
ncbi:MAG: hypothetical protein V1676_03870 [Candidatus Diapherotrites archaeon]